MKLIRWIMSLKCKYYGHKYFWHTFRYPGNGRSCWRCGFNQTWEMYWKEKENKDGDRFV